VLDAIPSARAKSATRPALNASALMPLSRDFAFVVDEDVDAERILKAVRGADKSLIGTAWIFDVFSGETVGAGKKSVAVTVTLQPRERSLAEQEIEAISKKIIAEVTKATNAVLRS
jgi:phenylalanyl-tRNA synthetase beta chain